MTVEECCLIELCRAGLSGDAPKPLPEGARYADVFALARWHEVEALAADAALRAADLPEDARAEAKRTLDNARYMEAVQFYETTELQERFAKRKTDYCLLKGWHWRSYYPAPWLRGMCDVDAVVRLEQWKSACAAMEEAGFSREEDEDIDLHAAYYKGDVKVELHRALQCGNHGLHVKRFLNPWGDFVPAGSACQWRLRPEDDYLYLFVHMEKHIGMYWFTLRMLTDIRVWREAGPSVDREAFLREAGRAGLARFAENMEALADGVLGNGPLSPRRAEMLEYLMGLMRLEKNESDYRTARRWLRLNATPAALMRRLHAPRAMLLSRYDELAPAKAREEWLIRTAHYYHFFANEFFRCGGAMSRGRRRELNRRQRLLYARVP